MEQKKKKYKKFAPLLRLPPGDLIAHFFESLLKKAKK